MTSRPTLRVKPLKNDHGMAESRNEGQAENSIVIPPKTKFCGGIKKFYNLGIR